MLSPDKHAISVIVGRLAPKGPGSEEEEESGEGNSQGLEAAAEDLIVAVGAKDAAGVAEALRNAFSILDSEPHEEGDHTEEEGAEVA
jgi:hypothetical protein